MIDEKDSVKMFEELKKIAEKEFGVTLVKSEKKTTFKNLFGFDSSDLKGMIENDKEIVL